MKFFKYIFFASAALGLVSCSEDKFTDVFPPVEDSTETPDDPGEQPGETVSSHNELYRPQIHYTPNANWMNDPNGLVYLDGKWHMYYQYNPRGNDWGNMSWGHAVSTDLMHWDEQPVAMVRNDLGDIFSGSAVVDKDNTAGFGAGAIVAIYTSAGEHQQQSIAYSTDGGTTFTQYEGNPVIANTVDGSGFRDPKVFWHNESSQWIMTLTQAERDWEWGDFRIKFYGSKNMKNWNLLSEFNTELPRAKRGQWECPDLIRMNYNGADKWVLIISSNPGGIVAGSGTMYFVGNFDGTTFTADDVDNPLWLDYGADNYAGVTWSNTPDSRVVLIGWMNNWLYAGAVPCSPWRSAMTLPRELKLIEVNGSPLLSTSVVKELDNIAGEWQNSADGICYGGDAYEMKFTVPTNETTYFRIGNDRNQYMEVEVNAIVKKIIANRTSTTGNVNFHNLFSIPTTAAPFNTDADELEIHVYVDNSSVEIITGDGTASITNLVFPTVPYDRISGVDGISYRPLKSIWK